MTSLRLRPFSACVLTFLVTLSSHAEAADPPGLEAAYQLLYAGDPGAARTAFERLVAVDSKGLPARFGLIAAFRVQTDANRTLEREFERQIDAFIDEAEARYDRSRRDDEALFYLANAHLARAVYRFDHDKGVWGTARDGARAKGLADTYIARHPEHGDAYFMLGAYNYYVEIAPAFVKLLRPLLFLPAGDRAGGLKQLERAYTQGNLFAPQAGQQLLEIYGSLEARPVDAVKIGEQLVQKYPDNTGIHFQLAALYSGPAFEDPGRAIVEYETVMAAEARRAEPRGDLFQARLNMVGALMQQWRLDEAIRTLSSTIDAKPSRPPGVMPVFLLQRAVVLSMMDNPRAADDAMAVLGEPRWKTHHEHAQAVVKRITARRASGESAIFAALVPGNRLAAEHRWDEAMAAYEPVRRQFPADSQVQYRITRLQFARGDVAAAATAASALAGEKKAPPAIRAEALLIVAHIDDLSGRREAAKKSYHRIVDEFEQEETVWPARVGLVTPYRRPQ